MAYAVWVLWFWISSLVLNIHYLCKYLEYLAGVGGIDEHCWTSIIYSCCITVSIHSCNQHSFIGWTLNEILGKQKFTKSWIKFQFSSVAQSCLTFCDPWITAHQASLSITNSRSSLRLTSIESVMPFSHLILCCPFLLSPIPPSISVFSNESTLLMRWPKYWSFSFSIIPSKEIPGLISFRITWLDLLAVQGTLKSLLQHHSSKASGVMFWWNNQTINYVSVIISAVIISGMNDNRLGMLF